MVSMAVVPCTGTTSDAHFRVRTCADGLRAAAGLIDRAGHVLRSDEDTTPGQARRGGRVSCENCEPHPAMVGVERCERVAAHQEADGAFNVAGADRVGAAGEERRELAVEDEAADDAQVAICLAVHLPRREHKAAVDGLVLATAEHVAHGVTQGSARAGVGEDGWCERVRLSRAAAERGGRGVAPQQSASQWRRGRTGGVSVRHQKRRGQGGAPQKHGGKK